jgi:hypothetical protein
MGGWTSGLQFSADIPVTGRLWGAAILILAVTAAVWFLPRHHSIPIGEPLYSNIVDMAACGPNSLVVATDSEIEELQPSENGWQRKTIAPAEQSNTWCTSDGSFLAAGSRIFWHNGDAWQEVDTQAFDGNIDQTLYPGPDAIVVLPNHMPGPTLSARRYRKAENGYAVDTLDLDLRPLFAFAQKTNPSAAPVMDISQHGEGETHEGLVVQQVLSAADGATAIMFNFNDATKTWIAWTGGDTEWHFGKLPDDTDPWFVTMSGASTLVVPVRAQDDDPQKNRTEVPYDIFRCRLEDSLSCDRIVAGIPNDHETIVVVRASLHLIHDEREDCY